MFWVLARDKFMNASCLATSRQTDAYAFGKCTAVRSPGALSLSVSDAEGGLFSGAFGIVAIEGIPPGQLEGEVVLVDPARRRIERLLRAESTTNTLLVTERCDQLCVMCSQPPKKTHVDRFDLLERACLLAPEDIIGISGGEPMLYKERLLTLMERTLSIRADLSFHVLTNGQHLTAADIQRLGAPEYRRVGWGIPLYSTELALHDLLVGKDGAFAQLAGGLSNLAMAGARIELRTVVMNDNVGGLPVLAGYVSSRLRFCRSLVDHVAGTCRLRENQVARPLLRPQQAVRADRGSAGSGSATRRESAAFQLSSLHGSRRLSQPCDRFDLRLEAQVRASVQRLPGADEMLRLLRMAFR